MPTTNRTRPRLLAVMGLSTVAVVVAVVAARAAAAPIAGVKAQPADDSAVSANLGNLTFDAELEVTYPPKPCAAGTPSGVECFARAGTGVIRGLGSVTESMDYQVESAPADCDGDMVRVRPTTARLSVRGKGEIELRLGRSGCVSRLGALRAQADFTITGGSGRFAEASGGGTYVDLSFGPPSYRGRDTWTGTLVVPGLDFDVTPPVLTGVRNRTIRAPRGRKRVRVAYSVRAHDGVDGALPVTCRPRSGSRFTVGRTSVRCSAVDTSANERAARFTVTVKRRR